MTYMTTMVLYLIVYWIQGSLWGWVVNKILDNKGYRVNWFWWGFFFGIFALIVALAKPNLHIGESSSVLGKNYVFRGLGNKTTDAASSWNCPHCGKVNAGYVGTCGCGCDKSGKM